MVTTYDSDEKVERWIRQKAGKSLKWAIAPDKGRIPEASWHSFSALSLLPRGTTVYLRVAESKTGIHIFLPVNTALTTEVVPPDFRQREEALRQREQAVTTKEKELREFEELVTASQRAVQIENATVSHKLSQLSSSVADNLKSWEQSSHDRIAENLAMLKAADEALQRAQSAESRNETAASIAYAADRIIGALQLWKAKSLKDIPDEMLTSFQEYMLDRAQRRFLAHLPDGPRKWSATFMQLDQSLRQETMRAITEAMKHEAEQRKKKPTGGAGAPPDPTPEQKQ